MAELRDWLNRKVLHIDIKEQHSLGSVSNVRLVFQIDSFIDNEVGWKTKAEGELRWYDFPLDISEVADFLSAARDWLGLPLNELGKTFFSGKWNWGTEDSNFHLEFGPYSQTPSKTDWFTVSLEIASQVLQRVETFHVDHSCLAIFVSGLSEQPDYSTSQESETQESS